MGKRSTGTGGGTSGRGQRGQARDALSNCVVGCAAAGKSNSRNQERRAQRRHSRAPPRAAPLGQRKSDAVLARGWTALRHPPTHNRTAHPVPAHAQRRSDQVPARAAGDRIARKGSPLRASQSIWPYTIQARPMCRRAPCRERRRNAVQVLGLTVSQQAVPAASGKVRLALEARPTTLAVP